MRDDAANGPTTDVGLLLDGAPLSSGYCLFREVRKGPAPFVSLGAGKGVRIEGSSKNLRDRYRVVGLCGRICSKGTERKAHRHDQCRQRHANVLLSAAADLSQAKPD
jgi:hypothetical protein